ncbi:MAG: metallo-mystery pair system four-Cys motif protein [Gemmatimonadota bacterium]
MMIRTRARLLPATLFAAFAVVAACSDEPSTPAGPIDVSLQFAAAVNGQSFNCGASFTNVGASQTTITPVDFRFYVHDVALLDSNGAAVPLTLEQDGLWQRENLALLDFENGSGPCVNGTAATNTTVRGEVPAGDYSGVRFTLGVPFSMNHQDQTTAQAPLDLTALFWSWNGGYKFARMDHTSAAQPDGWFVHLGSTGCSPAGTPTTPATACSNEHRLTVTFNGFDWTSNQVVADLGAILSQSDLTQNSAAKGCMSFPGDPECHAVLPALGLAYEGTAAQPQRLFSVR